MKKALNAPECEEIVTIEEHVKSSEVLKNADSSITFDYQLNDKASKSKILKAARRTPFEVEENSTSSNLVFSAGAWFHVALPSAKYFGEVKGEKTCKVGDYTVKVVGVKLGKEINGEHVHTQIVFYAHREKIVCHLYNTTQLILINGLGYRKFIDLFFKPFLVARINECLESIEQFNDDVVSKLGPKMVKRSDIKLKRGPSYPCQTCDFAAKSVPALRKHKKNDHVLGLNSSNKMKESRHSTRNNSVIEHLMIEDISSTDLESRNGNPLEENSLKYTCNECKYITTNKAHIDDYVKSQHLPCDNEEVQFVCIICKHEFKEAEDYETHVKIHDGQSEAENKEFNQLNNFIFNDILEHLAYETQNDNKCKCKKCELKTKRKDSNRAHKKTMHQQSKAKTVGVKCALCQYEFRSNVELEEHHDHEHSKKTETEQETETENIPGFNNLDKTTGRIFCSITLQSKMLISWRKL